MELLKQLNESVVSKSSLKQAAKEKAKGEKAADLTPHAHKVWSAKTLEDKKKAAHEMSQHFKVGGVDKFKADVNKCTKPEHVDKLAANALLKGEGKGVLK